MSQAYQGKDVEMPIKKFRQSMFKRVHKEERQKKKAAKAARAGKQPPFAVEVAHPKVRLPSKDASREHVDPFLHVVISL